METLSIALAVSSCVLLGELLVNFALRPQHLIALRYEGTVFVMLARYAGVFVAVALPGAILGRFSRRGSVARDLLACAFLLPVGLYPYLVPIPGWRQWFAQPTSRLVGGLVWLAVVAAVWISSTRAARRGASSRRARGAVFAVLFLLSVWTLRASGPLSRTPADGWLLVTTVGVPVVLALALAAVAGTRRALVAAGLSVACVLAATYGLPAHERVRAGSSSREAPDVLVIVIDTLRHDHAADPELAPRLSELAADGVTCESARSAAPWTTPSFGSILSSRYPSEHRAGMFTDSRRKQKSAMPHELETLAEVLHADGYWTGFVSTNTYLDRRFGLQQGFDVYQNAYATQLYHGIGGWLAYGFGVGLERYLEGGLQTKRILGVLDQARDSGRPWFVVAHYMDPHLPYQAPPEFRVNRPGLAGEYAAEVRHVDHHLGVLLDELRARGSYDDTLIVLTSDHGEELGEARDGKERSRDHGHTLFDELLRVPFVVKLPGNERRGDVVDEPVSGIDVAPTVLEVVGCAVPESFGGRSVLRLQEPRALLAEALLYGPEEQKAALRNARKIIAAGTPPTLERTLEYDLGADPGERAGRAPTPEARALFEVVRAFFELTSDLASGAGVELDPDQVDALRALGYADSGDD